MKTKTLLLGILMTASIFAQSDSIRTFGLPEMRILQKEKGKEITYVFDNSLNKFTLTPTTLLPDTNMFKYKVKLNDIREVSFHNGSQVWPVARTVGIVGFVLGFFAGGFFSWDSHPKFDLGRALVGAFYLGLPFALVGAVVGLLIPDYEKYDIKKLNQKQKYDTLRKLFSKYRLNRE